MTLDISNILDSRPFLSNRPNRIHKNRYQPLIEINWDLLGNLVRPDFLPPSVRSLKDGKARMCEYLEQREQRLGDLETFLSHHGVSLGTSEADVDAVRAPADLRPEMLEFTAA